MIFFGRSRTGRKLAKTVGYTWVIVNTIDFIAGKVGWLSLFTIPEDFKGAIDKIPKWEFFAGATQKSLDFFSVLINLATGYNSLIFVLLLIITLLTVDVDKILRHISFLKFRVRLAMSENIWISENEAAKIMRESDWGRLRSPYVAVKTSMFDNLNLSLSTTVTRVEHGMPERDKAILKFNIYVKRILNSFGKNNPEFYRDGESGPEYDEESIRNLATKLLDDDIESEFGSIPSTKL